MRCWAECRNTVEYHTLWDCLGQCRAAGIVRL